MAIVDCTLNEVNGGSMRVFVRKQSANPKNFGTQAYRDVCAYRVSSILAEEIFNGLDEEETWIKFYDDIKLLKAQVVEFITHAKSRGKTIMGYGASTKGNTLLQYFELDSTMIDAIAERQECKWGLRTVGTNIPIISEEAMRKAQPDYLLCLPWHFISEMFEREKDWHDKGGKWIVPMPKFEIL
jgi:NDP-4-keto-2,6-dideoxyhexose 3-C-methyltransferase